MLHDYYLLYSDQADTIPNWRKANKNDLCNQYLDESDEYKKSAYMAAIVCRYWQALTASYGKSFMSASEEDAYDWFIEAILYALSHAVWRDPMSKLYNDPNGPDKAINKKIKCARLTYFQQHNRYNRKINHEVESLDKIYAELGDSCVPSIVDTNEEFDCTSLVRGQLSQHNYFFALVIDLILNSDVFTTEHVFDSGKLVKQIKGLDDRYFKYFAKTYNWSYAKVESEFGRLKKISKSTLLNEFEYLTATLGRI